MCAVGQDVQQPPRQGHVIRVGRCDNLPGVRAVDGGGAGLHLPEANPGWTKEIEAKCRQGAKVRIAFGDPKSAEVRTRGAEEGVGEAMAARIQYALAWYRPILDTPNLEVRFHSTALYNSILRFDGQMLVNAHIYGIPAFRAPVLHLRRMMGEPLFDTYAECFDKVWAGAQPGSVE